MEREEIERVERELDAILKLVQPEPTIQDKAREEALSKEPASGGDKTDIRGIFNGRKQHWRRIFSVKIHQRKMLRNMMRRINMRQINVR